MEMHSGWIAGAITKVFVSGRCHLWSPPHSDRPHSGGDEVVKETIPPVSLPNEMLGEQSEGTSIRLE